MAMNKHINLISVLLVYVTIFFSLYPFLDYRVMILSIVLFGVVGWFYGPIAGLGFFIPITALHLCLLTIISAQQQAFSMALNPVALGAGSLVGTGTGFLKKSSDALKKLRSSLAMRVDEATKKQQLLTRSLIEKDEQERIQIGQDLHDGVGQYLTSMLLHIEALTLSLQNENHPETELAEQMKQRIEGAIHTIRNLSRSLLPIQFSETTIIAALEEMTAYFRDYSRTNICTSYQGESSTIPDLMAQQLHRIIHEGLYRAICKYNARDIDIRLLIGRSAFRMVVMGMIHTESISTNLELISEIMKYRISIIGGEISCTQSSTGEFRLECNAGFGEMIRK